MTNRENIRIKKKFQELREMWGGCCWNCGNTKKLEFAHREKDKNFNGMGRGRKERYYNIKNNPTKYWLGCKYCHQDYDRGDVSLDTILYNAIERRGIEMKISWEDLGVNTQEILEGN